MMDKIIQYQMRKMSTTQINEFLNEYTNDIYVKFQGKIKQLLAEYKKQSFNNACNLDAMYATGNISDMDKFEMMNELYNGIINDLQSLIIPDGIKNDNSETVLDNEMRIKNYLILAERIYGESKCIGKAATKPNYKRN